MRVNPQIYVINNIILSSKSITCGFTFPMMDTYIIKNSAGGGSVTFHLLSPISRHLINRGIIQSGTINAPWSLHTAEKAKEIANKLVQDCNCTQSADGKPFVCISIYLLMHR